MLETMNEIGTYFAKGQYKQCCKLLESQQNNGGTCPAFQPSTIMSRLHLNLCELLKETGSSSVNGELVDTCLKELNQCLFQIRSFRADMCSLSIELTTVYNWMYMKLVLCTGLNSHDIHSTVRECGQEYSKTLARVLSRINHKQQTSCYVGASVDTISEHLETLSGFAELHKFNRIHTSLCLSGCAWVALLMHNERYQDALRCIKSLLWITDGSLDVSETPLDLPNLTLCQPYNKGTGDRSTLTIPCVVPDLVNFLKSLCHYSLSQWAQCRESVTTINSQPLQSQTNLLLATCYSKEGKFDDSISLLQSYLSENPSITTTTKARLLTLIGTCYDKKGMHQCAVQMLKDALQTDFTYVLPLYYISQQYQKMALHDAELEALNLLTTILEDEPPSKFTPSLTLTDVWTTTIFKDICADQTITLPQSLYILAHRCLQLNRYDEGAQRYLDLLALLYTSPHLSQKSGKSSNIIELPNILTIFQETAKCLYFAGRHQDCVCICDKALESINLNSDTSAASAGADDISLLLTQDDSEADVTGSPAAGTSNSFITSFTESSKRKRPRVESCDLTLANQSKGGWKELQHFMTLTLFKADAHTGLKEEEKAIKSLHGAIGTLQEFIGHWTVSRDEMMSVHDRPAHKRRRTGEDGVVKTDSADDTEWKSQAVECCCRLATLLSGQQPATDSLHYARLAVQILPEDDSTWYTCCHVLERQGRDREAAKTWLKHRGWDNVIERRSLTKLLAAKQEALRKVTESSGGRYGEVSEKMILELDVRSLQHELRHQH